MTQTIQLLCVRYVFRMLLSRKYIVSSYLSAFSSQNQLCNIRKYKHMQLHYLVRRTLYTRPAKKRNCNLQVSRCFWIITFDWSESKHVVDKFQLKIFRCDSLHYVRKSGEELWTSTKWSALHGVSLDNDIP